MVICADGEHMVEATHVDLLVVIHGGKWRGAEVWLCHIEERATD